MSTIFAQRLREARKSRGYSQTELAEKCGLHASAIAWVSHYERGNRKPSLDNLVALCKALNISADWLLGLEQNSKGEYK